MNNQRHAAYTAGCLAAMDPPQPFVVPAEFRAVAEDWERGYLQTVTATGIHHRPAPKPVPKVAPPEPAQEAPKPAKAKRSNPKAPPSPTLVPEHAMAMAFDAVLAHAPHIQ